MRGTWQTTGGGGDQAVLYGAGGVVVILAVEFTVARIWWIIGGTVLAGAVAVAAVLWLMRWTARREAACAALGPLMVTREVPAVAPAGRKAIAGTVIRQEAPGAQEQAVKQVNRREPSC